MVIVPKHVPSLNLWAELLGSRLQQWNLLKESVRISVYRKRYEDLGQFFKMKGALLLALILMA